MLLKVIAQKMSISQFSSDSQPLKNLDDPMSKANLAYGDMSMPLNRQATCQLEQTKT